MKRIGRGPTRRESMSKAAPARRREIGAVIVHFGPWATTKRAVASFRRHSPDTEILIVNNEPGSQAPPDVGAPVLDAAGNFGYGAACNLGERVLENELLVFANNDTEILEGTVERLRAALADRRAAAVGPRFIDGRRQPRRSVCLAPTPWRILCENFFLPRLFPFLPVFRGHHTAYLRQNQPRIAETLLGALFLIHRDAFEDVGGFDESYFFYAEESDLFTRIRRRGWQILFEPGACAIHHESVASASLAQETRDRWLHEGFRRYTRSFHGPAGERRALRALRGGARLRWLISFVPGIPDRQARRARYADILRFHRGWLAGLPAPGRKG